MAIGFPGGGLFSRSGGQSGLGQLLGLGGGAPEFDSDQINALLQRFGGLQLPNSYQPQGMFENMPGISKRAPALAAGLDNALIALSNMGPTGSTAGENISNVARGLRSIGPTRREEAAAQLMTPLAVAGQVAQLQAQGSYQDYMKSMAQYYGGRNDASVQAAQARLQAGQLKNAMLAGKEGVILSDGTVGLPEVDDDGKLVYKSHPEIDAKAWQKQQAKAKLAGVMGNSMEGAVAQGILGDDPDSFQGGSIMGSKKYPKGRQGYFLAANDIMLAHRTAAAGVSAGGAKDRQETGEWATSQKDIVNKLQKGGGAKADEDAIMSRAAQLVSEGGGRVDPTKALEQARNEVTSNRNRITQAWGEFSLMDETEQRKRGGILGYLGSKGYDVKSGKFSETPQVQQSSSGPQLSPTVQAIMDSLRAPGANKP